MFSKFNASKSLIEAVTKVTGWDQLDEKSSMIGKSKEGDVPESEYSKNLAKVQSLHDDLKKKGYVHTGSENMAVMDSRGQHHDEIIKHSYIHKDGSHTKHIEYHSNHIHHKDFSPIVTKREKSYTHYHLNECTDLHEHLRPLDELSKNTLKSYVKKAVSHNHKSSIQTLDRKGWGDYHNDRGDLGQKAGETADRRAKGIGRAVDKLAKEDYAADGNTMECSTGKKSPIKFADKFGSKKRLIQDKDDHQESVEVEGDVVLETANQTDMTQSREIKNRVETLIGKPSPQRTTDTLRGREPGGKLNGQLPYKVDLTQSGKTEKFEDDSIKADSDTNQQPVDTKKVFEPGFAFKNSGKYSKPTLGKSPPDVINPKKKVTEEAEPIEELSTGLLGRYKSAARSQAADADKSGTRKGVDKANKRFSGIIKATKKQFDNETKVKTEEVEPLEELSRKTLGNYVKKAHYNSIKLGNAASEAEASGKIKKSVALGTKAIKRGDGIHRAVNKLSKEEVEPLEEISKETIKSYQGKAMKSALDLYASKDPADNAKGKRRANSLGRSYGQSLGYKLPFDKHGKPNVKKEEVEPLTELSKEKLKDYADKSHKDLEAKASKKDFGKTNLLHRMHGMQQVKDRLKKEEVEPLEEMKYENHPTKDAADASVKAHQKAGRSAYAQSLNKNSHEVRVMGTPFKTKTDDLKKEEVLDELSFKTLTSYADKAGKDADKHYDNWTRTATIASGEKSRKKVANRKAGINKSFDKMWKKTMDTPVTPSKVKKEEVEPLEELSKDILKSYNSKALDQGRAANHQNKHGGLSDSARDKNKALMNKRSAGMDKANNRLSDPSQIGVKEETGESTLSKIKNMARTAHKKIRKEMLSPAGGGSEAPEADTRSGAAN